MHKKTLHPPPKNELQKTVQMTQQIFPDEISKQQLEDLYEQLKKSILPNNSNSHSTSAEQITPSANSNSFFFSNSSNAKTGRRTKNPATECLEPKKKKKQKPNP